MANLKPATEESPTPRAEPCEACGKLRSVRAPICPHCGDKRPVKTDARERLRDWVVLVGLPVIGAIVGWIGTWQGQILNKARLNFEQQLAKQKTEIEIRESERDGKLAEQTAAFNAAESERQRAWQEYLDKRKETKEQTELALKLTEGLSEDNPGESVKALLLALCFVQTRHLDEQIIDVLTFHRPNNFAFRGELERALDYMRSKLPSDDLGSDGIRKVIDNALAVIRPGTTVKEAPNNKKQETAESVLNQPQAVSIGGLADVNTVVQADERLADSGLKETAAKALDVALEGVQSPSLKPTDPLLETVRASALPGPQGNLAVQAKLESAARDQTRVNMEARVAAVEMVLGQQNRFVVVYGKSADREHAEELANWARSENYIVSIWDVTTMSKRPDKPKTLEFRRCDTDKAKGHALDVLLPKLRRKLSEMRLQEPRTAQPLPHSVIAENEYEVWFPW
jgi:hypothetical protein